LAKEEQMIGNWELYGLSEAELHYTLADAHLQAALVLATALRSATYPQTFSNAKVIMSLHHHAAELCLKYALSRAGEEVPTHHHLRDLWHRYSLAYADPEFDFYPPFVTAFMGHTADQITQAIKEESERETRNKMDQEMRYHTDRDGSVWPGAHGVIPDTYPDEIARLRDRVHILHELIEKRMANKCVAATVLPGRQN